VHQRGAEHTTRLPHVTRPRTVSEAGGEARHRHQQSMRIASGIVLLLQSRRRLRVIASVVRGGVVPYCPTGTGRWARMPLAARAARTDPGVPTLRDVRPWLSAIADDALVW